MKIDWVLISCCRRKIQIESTNHHQRPTLDRIYSARSQRRLSLDESDRSTDEGVTCSSRVCVDASRLWAGLTRVRHPHPSSLDKRKSRNMYVKEKRRSEIFHRQADRKKADKIDEVNNIAKEIKKIFCDMAWREGGGDPTTHPDVSVIPLIRRAESNIGGHEHEGGGKNKVIW